MRGVSASTAEYARGGSAAAEVGGTGNAIFNEDNYKITAPKTDLFDMICPPAVFDPSASAS